MDWSVARERLGAPMFAALRPVIERLPRDRWPSHEELTQAAAGTFTSRGKPLRFVTPRPRDERERRYYELRIADDGEVDTRERNWHDLFNALVWIAYPGAKAAINAQHAALLEERGESEAKRRGPERDALTLFDEGGVAVLSSDERVFDRIRGFEWKRLFWTGRADLERSTRFIAFGHALLEKALEPHLGMVAKTVFLPATALPPDAMLRAIVDARLSEHFADRARFASPRAMAPMPVLGIPGWHPGTAREDFYDDRSHFRGKNGAPRE